jgi:iron complex transport system substrate-binding protein
MNPEIEKIAKDVVDASMKIHMKLGPGVWEIVYEVVLAHELRRRGYEVERQRPVPIRYDDLIVEEGFKADLIVNNCLLVELKSLEKLAPVHSKQVLTYIRLLDFRLGLLINFGEALLKNGIKRIAN